MTPPTPDSRDSGDVCVAVLPFAVAGTGDAGELARLGRGLAGLIEGRLRLLPGATVYVQHLIHAPEGDKTRGSFVARSEMWSVDEALELPTPDAHHPNVLVQALLTWGDDPAVAVEVIDVAAGYASFHEEVTTTDLGRDFLPKLFALLGRVARAIVPDLESRTTRAVARIPTTSIPAFRSYLLGLESLVSDQLTSRDRRDARGFEYFLDALRDDASFTEPALAIDLLAQEFFSDPQRPHARAVQALEEAMSLVPRHVVFRATLGKYHLERGELRHARTLLESYLEREKEGTTSASVAAAVCLATIYHRQRETEKALTLLKSAVERHPDSPELLETLGMCLAGAGRIKDAEACWRRVLEDHPRRSISLSNLGTILWQREDMARARTLLERSIEDIDASPLVYTRLIEFHLEQGQLSRADEVATEQVERFADDWQAWARLAVIRRRQGQVRAAEYALERAEKMCPTDESDEQLLIARLAVHHPTDYRLYLRTRRAKPRPAVAKESPEEERDRLRAHEVGMIRALRTLAERHPRMPVLWWDLGTRLVGLEQFESAAACLARYVDLLPNDPNGFERFGACLLRAGRAVEAAEAMRRAARLSPDNAGIHLHLAAALASARLFADARLHAQRADLLEPGDERVARLLERLDEWEEEARPAQPPAGMMRRLLGWLRRGQQAEPNQES